ncbi:MAG: GxxExxY protein [Chitinophagaceae bacterium]
MIKSEYKHSEITEIVIGCAMKVHNSLGKGFPEAIYQRAFLIELNKTELIIEREIEQAVYYEEQLVGKRRVDFLINKIILVETKAKSELDNSCINQILNYIEAFNLEIGLLINFGKDRLEFKRFTNNKVK